MEKITGIDRIRLELHKQLSKPEYIKRGDKTFCNIFVFNFLTAFDLQKPFYNEAEKRIMIANEIYDKLLADFHKVNLDEVLENYPSSNIYLASCKGQEHGHIAVIYPSFSKVYSNKWNRYVPLVANAGLENSIMGLNWAFQKLPDFFFIAGVLDIDNIYD